MAGSDYRPLDARLGTVFGERFLKKWHCQVSIYPKVSSPWAVGGVALCRRAPPP